MSSAASMMSSAKGVVVAGDDAVENGGQDTIVGAGDIDVTLEVVDVDATLEVDVGTICFPIPPAAIGKSP